MSRGRTAQRHRKHREDFSPKLEAGSAAANGLLQPCPLCGGTLSICKSRLRDNRTGVFQERFDVMKCADCGVRGLRPMPEESSLSTGYEEGYGPYAAPETNGGTRSKGPALWVDVARRWWHVIDGNPSVDRVPVKGRVLDVGANQGQNVEYLIRRGYDVVGIEPNRRAVAVCRAKGLPVLPGTLEDNPFAPESFDTVILSQVFEHLTDPMRSLNSAFRLLRSGGCIVLLTPNPDGIQARIFANEWAHWHVPYHVYLYGRPQLCQMLRRSGFGVRRVSTVSASYWFAMSLALWHHRSQSSKWNLPAGGTNVKVPARVLLALILRPIDILGLGDCLVAVGVKG